MRFLLYALPTQSAAVPGPAADTTGSAAEIWPAARRHVRILDGRPYKFTSRLTHVVELNFTFGWSGDVGKAAIAGTLDRLAKNYGGEGGDAFTVRHFKQGTDGATGLQPSFTLEDLMSGEVVVANNLSQLGSSSLGREKQEAIQRAIEVEGRGYLAFHRSGDNEQTGWPWLNTTLHPMRYQGRGARTVAPVYKHLAESSHVVLERILETRTTLATVPDELDSLGNEAFAQNVPTRLMLSEWFRWGRDISRDAAYQDKVTLLLKYDPRNVGLDPRYRRAGGNMFTCLYKVGAGMTSFVLPGLDNDELLDRSTGFDGGAGDWDRYVAQTLFFLAGYDTTACDASCNGLPTVDANNRLTGEVYTHTSKATREYLAHDLRFDPAKPAFTQPHDAAYAAVLIDLSGKVVASKHGKGAVHHEFDRSNLKPGVYCLSVKLGMASAKVKRYAITTSAP